EASSSEYSAMMVTVSAKIATAYMQLRTLQTEVDVLNRHIAQQKRVADITNARHEAGLASMLDVSQALTTYYSTKAAMQQLNTGITTTINAIAVLTGTFPDDITQMLSRPMPMPAYQKIVAVGMPMDLLRRRPDVAEAEYTLAGYAAALGVAKKDFLPTLSLSGSIGTAAHDASDLFGKHSYTYTVAPTLSWTIFDGMNRNAAMASARRQMEAGIDNYNNTVLTAVQEVDNAMATYYNNVKYIEMVNQVVEQAEKAFDLSIDLYKQGLTDFVNVSNSQISYLTYSNELVEAKGQALSALVNLYQALGGGWVSNQ
ncbi:MAG: efflux transporter outer membrane subunit, partial [Muribaculaceae bacterium]|nr:efflux transporter outer membrane subunit [Muribaculaceae bacterium]